MDEAVAKHLDTVGSNGWYYHLCCHQARNGGQAMSGRGQEIIVAIVTALLALLTCFLFLGCTPQPDRPWNAYDDCPECREFHDTSKEALEWMLKGVE